MLRRLGETEGEAGCCCRTAALTGGQSGSLVTAYSSHLSLFVGTWGGEVVATVV
jgi:hypothetical protein